MSEPDLENEYDEYEPDAYENGYVESYEHDNDDADNAGRRDTDG
jgi:hypothetical protein